VEPGAEGSSASLARLPEEDRAGSTPAQSLATLIKPINIQSKDDSLVTESDEEELDIIVHSGEDNVEVGGANESNHQADKGSETETALKAASAVVESVSLSEAEGPKVVGEATSGSRRLPSDKLSVVPTAIHPAFHEPTPPAYTVQTVSDLADHLARARRRRESTHRLRSAYHSAVGAAVIDVWCLGPDPISTHLVDHQKVVYRQCSFQIIS
jgi:hypothetical protein